MTAPRVRFAPSPTGYFHVGGARTALFNWLFARQQGGVFVLRIEDTDVERNREEFVEGILRAMEWLGLDWDEGPFFQSQRGELYQAAIDKLIADGKVYACDCTSQAVQARGKPGDGGAGYDGFCRDRGLDFGPGKVLRFKTPDEGTTTVVDLVRGVTEFANANIEDFAVRKSSGQPLFILANVVDDADMAITHVIRGEDHLPNTPKYQLLWEALGYGPLPVFAHLPLLVNEKRQKLSKRRDKVAVEDYRDEGYLPEALRNYLVLLGWSPGEDRENLTVEEMISSFRLSDVRSSPAFFDVKKLQAFNAEYIRALPVDEFMARSEAWLRDRWAPIAPLVQERVRTLSEVFAMVDFLYRDTPIIDERDWERGVRQQPAFARILELAEAALATCPWEASSIHDALVGVAEEVGVQLRKVDAPVRLAVTGRSFGPPLFDSLAALGRDRTLTRLRAARARLDGGAGS
jgi:glutamyl-tRNA synthetase